MEVVSWNFTSILMTHARYCMSWLPPLYYPARMASAAFLFTHMLVVHGSEGGGIYCLGSGEPWKLHYDIKGAAASVRRAAGPATSDTTSLYNIHEMARNNKIKFLRIESSYARDACLFY